MSVKPENPAVKNAAYTIYVNSRKSTMYQNAKRHELRQAFADVYHKMQSQAPLSDLEQQIASVVSAHPEYHAHLNNIDKDYTPEMGQTNPFLHMSLHLGIREQVALNRPEGITEIYDHKLKIQQDVHDVEHAMMETLAEVLHDAQKNGHMPDEQQYLTKLRQN